MAISSWVNGTRSFLAKLWRRFTNLARWAQVLIVLVLLIIVGSVIVLLRGNSTASSSATLPTVTVQSIDSFGGNSNGVSVLGTVQSVSEAAILAQSGGTVTAVNTKLGANVPAGFVIANLDSAAASAAVLQAQGGYDAAVAAERAINLQSQNSSGSFADAQTNVRTTYTSTYTSLESVLATDVDTLFGANTPTGPALTINPLNTGDTFPRGRRQINALMDSWNASLATANTTDPLTLLSMAQSNLQTVSAFLTSLATLAHSQGSGATSAQLTSLATAQASVSSLLSGIAAARTTYNAAATASAVGQTQGNGGSGVTSSQAAVESALGALRSAQAAYEKTVIRAPIGGTVNYLPISVGDFASVNQHVATVARNNALEVVMELSQADSNRVAVGDKVTIQGSYKGVVTTIAPALDPITKQIEVHVAVDDTATGASLVNGQSVQVSLPALVASKTASTTATGGAIASTTPTVELPLTAVKLLPNERDVFSVDSTGHLVAHQVQIGDVIGNLIEITTPLDPALKIVTDVRGLSAGDAVLVASSTPLTQ